MFTSPQLAALANSYCAATDTSLSALGMRLFNDHQFFKRLNSGMDCRSLRAAELSRWFVENWPDEAQWPDEVPRELAA